MKRLERRELKRWLEAEAADRPDEADAALVALFARLPSLAPAPGFAGRVLRAAGLAAAPRRPVPRAVRWLAAASLSLIAVYSALLPLLAGPLVGRASLGGLVDVLTRATVTLAAWLRGALGVWDILASLSRAVAAAVETPPVALIILASLGAAALALRWLSDLIATERSWTYVRATR